MDLTNVVLAILGIGALVAFHELGHHLVALWTGMRVRKFAVGFGPAILKKTHNGVDYQVGALPLGGYVDIVGMNPLEEGADRDPQSFQRRPRWARALVVGAGPAFNYVLAFVIFVGLFWLGGLKRDQEFPVREVLPDTAAEAAGIQADDVVVKVGGEVLGSSMALPEKVAQHAGKPLELTIRRGEEILTITAVPRGEPGQGKLGVKFDARGVGPTQNYSLSESINMAGRYVVLGTLRILEDVARMLRPGEKVEVGGPVAIVDQLKKSASHSLSDFIWMLATLSLMLGLFNLFPIPPLDGSKLMFLGAEAVARRNIPARLQLYVHGVGMILMLSILLLVTVGDVGRLISPDKGEEQKVEQKAQPEQKANP
ncbi:MAG: M50 family metallopeptidase [Myxococcota bacterium]